MGELERGIMALLDKKNIPYEVIEHPPVYTNPEMAERLGCDVSQTAKNLMLATAEGKIIQVVLPGDKRFDNKRVAKKAGTKSVTFAGPEQVLEYAGCEIGCVPPFGHLLPVPVYMDRRLLWKKSVYFNPGVHTKSVKLEAKRLKELCAPTML